MRDVITRVVTVMKKPSRTIVNIVRELQYEGVITSQIDPVTGEDY